MNLSPGVTEQDGAKSQCWPVQTGKATETMVTAYESSAYDWSKAVYGAWYIFCISMVALEKSFRTTFK
jgi:hypothetical protein